MVAFDIGPHPEVIKNGKLVPQEDLAAFAKAIKHYLSKKAIYHFTDISIPKSPKLAFVRCVITREILAD